MENHADQMPDFEPVRQAALDYIEAWYSGDAQRMEGCLHPDLAKRTIRPEAQPGYDRLEPISALGMVIATRRGVGTRPPPAEQEKEIQILDIHGNIASVKVISREMVDYLHLGKFMGQWLIVNVLWARK